MMAEVICAGLRLIRIDREDLRCIRSEKILNEEDSGGRTGVEGIAGISLLTLAVAVTDTGRCVGKRGDRRRTVAMMSTHV